MSETPKGFDYRETPWRFQAEWSDGEWTEGELVSESTITIDEGATCLHYAQQCFEGLKSYASPDGTPLLFRVDQNAARLRRTAARLLMPEVSEELFLRGVHACVHANRHLLPPNGGGGSLYVRPLLIGVGENLGLRPAPRYVFRVFCSPVGPYFADGLKGIRLLVTDQDRVAPRGMGSYKAGGNYGGGLMLTANAKKQGHNEVLYLDPTSHTRLEEAGSANVFGVRGETLVTPGSSSILPSITMDSLLQLARDRGLAVERRDVPVGELADWEEMGCTGTAAVITPVAQVTDGEQVYRFTAPGPHTKALYDELTGIQYGNREDRHGWVTEVTTAQGAGA